MSSFSLKFETFDSVSFCGYEQKTTFFMDFSIAEHYLHSEGAKGIDDTFKRALKYGMTDYEIATELVLVMNWKLWLHYERGNDRLARLYDNYWRKAIDAFFEKFGSNEKACSYYYRMTD